MLTIIDIGIGNVNSVSRALSYLRIENQIASDPGMIRGASRLIFPGVGNFFEASKRLDDLGIRPLLNELVTEKRIPILGICLGMQLLADWGEEGGGSEGLGWIQGRVERLKSQDSKLRLPHVGWNDVSSSEIPFFKDHQPPACFYFTHSYAMQVNDPGAKIAVSQYGVTFTAAVQKKNILGVQFHPEKSQKAGLSLLKAFSSGDFAC